MNVYRRGVGRIPMWSLREDVTVETDPDTGEVLLLSRWGEVRVDRPGPALTESLARMSLGPVSVANTDEPGLAELLDGVQHLVVRALGLEDGSGPLLSVVPIVRDARFTPAPPPEGPVRLSRLATMRSLDDALVLESPLSAHRVVLHHPVAAAVAAELGAPTTLTRLAWSLDLPLDLVADLITYLVGAGVVVVGTAAPARFAEDTDPALQPWSHHELLFHARSRTGGDDGLEAYPRDPPPEPAVKTPPVGARTALFRPALAQLLAADPPVTAALEAIRPHTAFGAAPVTAHQLGELLYRTARVRSLSTAPPVDGATAQVSDRPHPTTAGLHELELYVVTDRCAGISRAVHHYDPLEHVLTRVDGTDDDVSELLDNARVTGGLTERPPVLISITARFHRLPWVHQDGAYAGTLKHVGLLQQTLYLVATAMGLAGCAVAGGADDRTERVLGLDWWVESKVGDFVLGSPPDGREPDRVTLLVNDPEWPDLSRSVIDARR